MKKTLKCLLSIPTTSLRFVDVRSVFSQNDHSYKFVVNSCRRHRYYNDTSYCYYAV